MRVLFNMKKYTKYKFYLYIQKFCDNIHCDGAVS